MCTSVTQSSHTRAVMSMFRQFCTQLLIFSKEKCTKLFTVALWSALLYLSSWVSASDSEFPHTGPESLFRENLWSALVAQSIWILDFYFKSRWVSWYQINSLLLNVKDLTFMCTCVVQQQPVQRNPVVGSKGMLHNLRALCGLQILQQIFSDINADEIRLESRLISVPFLFRASEISQPS